MTALKAGILYGAFVFTLGVVLGTLREVWLASILGRDAVVMSEIVLILLFAWLLCWWIVGDTPVPKHVAPRLVMGAAALALVLCGEAAVAVLGMGRSLAMHLSTYTTSRGVLELLPQIAFSLFPLAHLLRERTIRP